MINLVRLRLLLDRKFVVAVHPDSVTDELRELVESRPHAELRVSVMVPAGRVFIVDESKIQFGTDGDGASQVLD